MIFFILVLLLVIFSSAKYEKANEFNVNYIDRNATNNIKGIFVILILFSHAKSYLSLGGVYDEPYVQLQNHLGQMVVAMFLFYSGFGMMEQIKKRGFSYITTIPKKRFLNLLLNFDISILLFLILNLAIGKKYSVSDYLTALIAWGSVGNSNWYIFDIFVLYAFTFISFFIIKWKRFSQMLLFPVVLNTILSIAFIWVFKTHFAYMGTRWYNTFILFVLGMWYSYFRETVEKVMMKNDVIFYTVFAFTVCAYLYTYLHNDDNFAYYVVWSVIFTLGIVFITMKVRIESELLKWFGEHIFSIYILQRIPMHIMVHFGIDQRHKYVFMVLAIAFSCAIAAVFDYFTGKISNAIWKPKTVKN